MQKDTGRPAVVRNVMSTYQKDMVALVEPNELIANHRVAGEIKRHRRLAIEPLACFVFALPHRKMTDVDHLQRFERMLGDNLIRLTLFRAVICPQYLMSRYDSVDSRFQCLDVESTSKAQCSRDVIHRIVGFHLVQYPQPLLRK